MTLDVSGARPMHHPSLETLTAYAAGTLRAGFDVVTAVHVKSCAQCRKDVAELESVAGALLGETEGAAMEEAALAHTLARLDSPADEAAPAETLDDLLGAIKRRWVAPGVWVAKVDTPHDKEDRIFILSAAPGAATATHTHKGAEFTQILSGALDDEGVVYRAGDFTERSSDHTHQPHTVGDEPCVCLFAIRGTLTPTDWIGRIAFAIADL